MSEPHRIVQMHEVKPGMDGREEYHDSSPEIRRARHAMYKLNAETAETWAEQEFAKGWLDEHNERGQDFDSIAKSPILSRWRPGP